MILSALEFAARHGRWCLMLGLLAGLTLPGLTLVLRPWLPPLIAGLLFIAALRIGPRAAVGGLSDVGRTLRMALIYQLAAPILALLVLLALGLSAAPWAVALVLVLSAPPVTGSPNFTILMNRDPAIAMRLLLVGTAIFPIAAMPILWLSPVVETLNGVLIGAFWLMSVIFGAVGLAFSVRRWVWPEVSDRHKSALDGASAILLGVVVVGLMSAIGPALKNSPTDFALWLAFAFALNFSAQAIAARFMPLADRSKEQTGAALVAGNRNIALFLVALPEATMEPVLLFIGCYQLPMYLTPILMRRVLTKGT